MSRINSSSTASSEGESDPRSSPGSGGGSEAKTGTDGSCSWDNVHLLAHGFPSVPGHESFVTRVSPGCPGRRAAQALLAQSLSTARSPAFRAFTDEKSSFPSGAISLQGLRWWRGTSSRCRSATPPHTHRYRQLQGQSVECGGSPQGCFLFQDEEGMPPKSPANRLPSFSMLKQATALKFPVTGRRGSGGEAARLARLAFLPGVWTILPQPNGVRTPAPRVRLSPGSYG
jgi:hypothetical protein